MQLDSKSVVYMFEFESIATPYGVQKEALMPTPSEELHVAPVPAKMVTSKMARVG